MTVKYTPGPWAVKLVKDSRTPSRFEPNCCITAQYNGSTIRLADIPDCIDAESEANATLIASAPELLETLQLLQKALHDAGVLRNVRKQFSLYVADAAATKIIAKAQGEDKR